MANADFLVCGVSQIINFHMFRFEGGWRGRSRLGTTMVSLCMNEHHMHLLKPYKALRL